jgi:hypothetical protein
LADVEFFRVFCLGLFVQVAPVGPEALRSLVSLHLNWRPRFIQEIFDFGRPYILTQQRLFGLFGDSQQLCGLFDSLTYWLLPAFGRLFFTL